MFRKASAMQTRQLNYGHLLASALLALCLVRFGAVAAAAAAASGSAAAVVAAAPEVEGNAEAALVGSLQAAAHAPEQEESYQRVYEAFTRLVSSVSNNSLGNARRLVSRLNQLVGGTEPQVKPQQTNQRVSAETSEEQRTEQILQRLDQVNKQTDQNTLRQLQEDVNRLVGSLNESYLRNIRRVIERVNKTIGTNSTGALPLTPPAQMQYRANNDKNRDKQRKPDFSGFEGFLGVMEHIRDSFYKTFSSSHYLLMMGKRR